MTCPFAHYDGSYVLGGLSATERRAFEEHLAGCDACARAVTGLAGLPGLLARVDPTDLEPPTVSAPVPDTLLPALLREVRRTGRRRTLAAAAVAAAVGSLSITGVAGGHVTPLAGPTPGISASPAPGTGARAMVPTGATPIRATVTLHGVAWGTRLDMTCTYDPPATGYAAPPPATYVLVVQTRDGQTQQVASWRSLPGRTMQLSAASAAGPAQIASVEVRTGDGRPVLRLRV